MKSKVLDTSIAKMYGWRSKKKFDKAIIETYNNLESNYNKIRS